MGSQEGVVVPQELCLHISVLVRLASSPLSASHLVAPTPPQMRGDGGVHPSWCFSWKTDEVFSLVPTCCRCETQLSRMPG